MIEKLIYFDSLITDLLKNLVFQNYFFDLFFSFFSLKGNSIFVWTLVIIIALFLEEKNNPGISKNDKNFIFIFGISFLLTSFLVTYPLKNLFKRPRPIAINLQQPRSHAYQCPTDYSFPSGHAATAFNAATILTFFDKKRQFFYCTIAFLIAYSRIYLGCHYFLDVLGGGVLGIFISKFLIRLFKNIKKIDGDKNKNHSSN